MVDFFPTPSLYLKSVWSSGLMPPWYKEPTQCEGHEWRWGNLTTEIFFLLFWSLNHDSLKAVSLSLSKKKKGITNNGNKCEHSITQCQWKILLELETVIRKDIVLLLWYSCQNSIMSLQSWDSVRYPKLRVMLWSRILLLRWWEIRKNGETVRDGRRLRRNYRMQYGILELEKIWMKTWNISCKVCLSVHCVLPMLIFWFWSLECGCIRWHLGKLSEGNDTIFATFL